jgi:hypothetical protein
MSTGVRTWDAHDFYRPIAAPSIAGGLLDVDLVTVREVATVVQP